MKTVFRASFQSDVKKLRDVTLLASIREAIEKIEQAQNSLEVVNLKKLRGAKGCYRVRVGEYRLGLIIVGDTVEFVRCLNRREIYRYFP